MALNPIDKSWSTNKKDIKYLNRDFASLRQALIEFTKTYFSNTYNDFSESTPGNIFIELASYVGDVMSFYLDTQIQENFLLYTKEKENLYAISYTMGYRPRASYAAHTTVDIYQLIPTTISGTSIAQTGNTGILIRNDQWYSLYTGHGMDSSSDMVITTLTDKASGIIHRVTFIRADDGSTTGYNIFVEKLW